MCIRLFSLLKNLVGAARSDNLEAVKYILEYGRNVDINATESDKVSQCYVHICMYVCTCTCVMVCVCYVCVCVSVCNHKNIHLSHHGMHMCTQHGWTALMWATEKGNFEMVELLLERRADLNASQKGSYAQSNVKQYVVNSS